jgi:inner membrane protein
MAGFGHVAVGLVSGRLHRETWDGGRLVLRLLGFALLAMLPDFDVLAVALGVPDPGIWGHRGVSHTPAFALCVGLLATLVAWCWHARPIRLGLIVTLVVGSHALLDALTQEGRGMMFLWPLAVTRFHFPWRPIPDAPRGLAFFSAVGLRHLLVELVYFAPFTLYSLWPRWVRRRVPRLVGWALPV